MAVEGGRKVMVAIDESDSSYYALIWALENLVETIKGAGNPLVIFMAKPPPKNNNVFAASLGAARAYCTISAMAAPEYVNSVQQLNKSVIVGILEKATSICSSYGVNAETIAEIGDPEQAICDAVKRSKITLLVIGEHELGRFKSAFVGSMSNYCVSYSACPVLVVKKPE